MIIHCHSSRYIWEVLENEEYKFLFNDLVVVDLGCNIGTFSLWIYDRTKEIHAIDMEQQYIDDFNKSIKDNGYTNIHTYTERMTNLNDFLSGHNIPIVDVLKIDVEGDEISIFENNFPKEKVRMIVGEYHTYPVKELLEHMGYRYFEYPNKHFLARL